MSLDKVLRLASAPERPADASELVRLASENLERLALLLASADEDDDGEGDDEDDEDEDQDDDEDGPPKKGKKPSFVKGKKPAFGGKGGDDSKGGKGDGKKVPPWLAKKQEKVKASRALVLDAMVALSQLGGGEVLSLSVLTQAEREKPSAHTIPGSTDFPIPDKVHLAAAVARYKQGKLAGHSQDEVARHIRTQAKRLGEMVDLTAPDLNQAVILLARGGSDQAVAMEHGPMSGEHEHPHRVVNVHSHRHTHNGDSRHACGDPGYGAY